VINKLKKFYIIYISFFIILTKWLLSFYFFQEEIDVKILFESVTDGKYYYPLIKYLSDLNFTASFDPNIESLKTIPVPISSLFLHAIFLKIFDFYSFILLEFLSLTIFILLLYKINRFIFSKKISLFCSLLILISPSLINLSLLNEIQFLKIFGDNLYNFRVPRPMISNLFLLAFIYLTLKMYSKNQYNIKNFALIGLVMGLSLSSFYYYFFLESITLASILFFRYKQNFIKNIITQFKYYRYLILTFFISSLPFLINLYLHEKDFTSRQCVYGLTLEYKQTLFKFYLSQFTEIDFIIVFFSVILTTIWINFKNHKNKKFLNLFCILFIASVLNPLFFILISNKACVFYHFNNLIIITGILFFIFFVMIYLEKFFNSLLLIKFDKIINLSLILFLCFSFYSSNLNNFEDINHKTSRKEFNNVTKKIRSIDKIENISILTFDTDFMIWAIMNDIKYLSLINGLFSSKTDRMIEEDIFSAFKVLNLSTENFNKFLNNENDKSSWRYLNLNISTFFFYKYQANSMITFKNMKEFTDEELKFLKRSSPILHQQSIIPKLELERLKNEFENFMNLDPNPDILILNVNDNFYEMRELNLINYCLEYKGQNYFLYKQKNKYKCQEIN
tara:strand:+ start:14949 stop:16808 length:1860 start_codon:yes stop_codon:yes gene_type:complete